jgi:antitoxin component YwqK of YwqJK toxin-antitoxin module
MRICISFLVSTILLISCAGNTGNSNAKTLNRAWLDSIIKTGDSSYTKPYKRTDFVTATFYVNKKDSVICQVMKDSADSIRQVIIAKNDLRSFFAQYYANGVLQADLPLDEFGQHHGKATFYYENGNVQSSGFFNHGLKSGEWKVYDEKGKLTSTDKYDNNGQLIKPHQPQSVTFT